MLDEAFKIKNLKNLTYFRFWGCKGIHLCQCKYTSDLLTNILASTPISTPMNFSTRISFTTSEPLSDPSSYLDLLEEWSI